MDASVSVLAPEPAARVSTLELFFDLVFVFTITRSAISFCMPRVDWRSAMRWLCWQLSGGCMAAMPG